MKRLMFCCSLSILTGWFAVLLLLSSLTVSYAAPGGQAAAATTPSPGRAASASRPAPATPPAANPDANTVKPPYLWLTRPKLGERQRSVFYQGQPFRIELYGYLPPASDRRLTWRLVDLRNRVLERGEVNAAGGENSLLHAFTFQLNRCGPCRLEVTTADGRLKTETLWSIFAPRRDRGGDLRLGGTGIDPLPELTEACGLGWRRRLYGVGDTRQPQIMNQGTPNTKLLSRALALEKRLGLRPVGYLAGPLRAADLDDKNFPAWLDQWLHQYVIPLANASKDQIGVWEISFDPVYQAHPERYVQMLRATSSALKKINPEFKIIGISTYFDERLLQELFQLGALDYCDILGVRLNSSANVPAAAPEQRFVDWFARLRNLLREFNQSSMPVWNLDFYLTPPATMYTLPITRQKINYRGLLPPDPRQQAATMSRIAVEHLAAGVNLFYSQFAYSPAYFNNIAEYDGSPMAMASALAAAFRLLPAAGLIGQPDLHERLRSHLFRIAPDEVLLVGWITPRRTANEELIVPLPPDWWRNQVRDHFGNRIAANARQLKFSAAPIFVTLPTSPELRDAELMQRLRALPLTFDAATPTPQLLKLPTPTAADWKNYAAIDLRAAANRDLVDSPDPFADQTTTGYLNEPFNDLGLLPPGDLLDCHRIPLRIIDPAANERRGCLILRGAWRFFLPTAVTITPVDSGNRPVKRLHCFGFLYGGRLQPDTPVMTLVVNLTDGRQETFELKFKRDLHFWSDSLTPDAPNLGLLLPGPMRDTIAISRAVIPLSRPATIESIELKTPENAPAAPVILAITAELDTGK